MEPTASQVERVGACVRAGASTASSQVVQGAFMGSVFKRKAWAALGGPGLLQ
jgi:hypothetical protein